MASNSGNYEKSEIRTLKVVDFYSDDYRKFKAQILLINGLRYFGLSKFYFDQEADKFKPTKKSIYLREEIWEEFLQIIPRLALPNSSASTLPSTSTSSDSSDSPPAKKRKNGSKVLLCITIFQSCLGNMLQTLTFLHTSPPCFSL